LPVTPGGTVLGTGTAVDALSSGTSGSTTSSLAMMTYSFEATGPANVEFIPIQVISTGLVSTSGDAGATLSLVVKDASGDGNIPPGVPDPDPPGSLLSLSAACLDGSCVSSWGVPGHQVIDTLCVVNGDNYTLTISAATLAGRGTGANTASATLDPLIKFDPPYPTTCSPPANLDEFSLNTSPGTSTGFVTAPEPPTLWLAALGALGCVGFGLTRRSRPGIVAARR
jgi:hypothetical protein